MNTTNLIITNIKLDGLDTIAGKRIVIPPLDDIKECYYDDTNARYNADPIADYITAQVLTNDAQITFSIAGHTELPVPDKVTTWTWDMQSLSTDKPHYNYGQVVYNMDWDQHMIVEVPTDKEALARAGGLTMAIELYIINNLHTFVDWSRYKAK